jgi:hypothetical protein
VRRAVFILIGLLFVSWAACRQFHSNRSFDQICELVQGKSAAEVEDLLGAPDVREEILEGDERWVWWDYTFLDGEGYPPEIRGQVVHLEIQFQNPSRPLNRHLPYSQWRMSGPLAVSYSFPFQLPRAATY